MSFGRVSPCSPSPLAGLRAGRKAIKRGAIKGEEGGAQRRMRDTRWPGETPHPPFGHLLPQGEKALWRDRAHASLRPLGEKVDRPQAETDEGKAHHDV